jgi:hypothetical protein
LTLHANADRPIVNPAFVIENWAGEVKVRLNGKPVMDKKEIRIGHSHNLNGENLILWLQLKSDQPLQIQLQPVK